MTKYTIDWKLVGFMLVNILLGMLIIYVIYRMIKKVRNIRINNDK